ncbi:MAG: ROK family protein [Proteobacteria bacterium]|nr:ROK family protein [Pseudomonadota bacterium]
MSGTVTGQGSNSAIVRQFNERVILTALRRLGEASKADLARQVNLTQNAAGQIVKELERQKLVRITGKRTGLRGQPATLLQLDPEGAYSIGIKLGRRTLDSILVDFSGAVLKARQHEGPLPRPEEALKLIRDDIAALRRGLPPTRRMRLAGVGLAIPYNLGAWRRELDIPAEICSAWNGFDFTGRLRAAIEAPLFVENDGTAVAVAELFQGHGRELDDFAVIYIGAAVGGGLVLDGQFRRGATGNAGDVGLMPVAPSRLSSAPPPAGPYDILLSRASIAALVRHLRANGVPASRVEDFEMALAREPALVGEWLEDCADALVVPLLSIAAMLDLQAIVIDGNLPRALIERLVERLRALLAAHAPEARQAPALRIGTIGRNAAAIGAATLPLHESYGADQGVLFGA